ncbi:MAG: hypothetical protein HOP10_12550 [Chitinophagaceae bacterium]|nr:hypothetical protein [Chitinophagaceae bacterium]
MKRKITSLLFLGMLACNKSKSPDQLGIEVCDCFKKNLHISFPNPDTGEAEDECAKMQVNALQNFKSDSNKKKQFNKALRDCASPMIEKLFNDRIK